MASNSVARAQNGQTESPADRRRPPALTQPQRVAVQMFARGATYGAVAKLLEIWLVKRKTYELYKDTKAGRRKIHRLAKTQLKRWTRTDWFREALWEEAVAQTDLSVGEIMAGVVKRAKRGNVPAARLALEVTGRHGKEAQTAPAVVNLNFGSVPRPSTDRLGPADLELEAVEEDE